MAKDKITISILAGLDSIESNLSKFNVISVKGKNGLTKSVIYGLKVGNYYIKFMSNLEFADRLQIDCSISKVYNGTNSKSKTNVTIEEFYNRVINDLKDYINFEAIGDVYDATISRDETFIDLIVPNEIKEDLFRVLKSTQPSRKKVDLTYYEKGTIYYYSGNTRSKLGAEYKVYDKVKEALSRGEVIEVPPNHTIIRFEAKGSRNKLVHSIKKLIKSEIELERIFNEAFITVNDTNYMDNIPFAIDLDSKRLDLSQGIRIYSSVSNYKYKFNMNTVNIETSYKKRLNKRVTIQDICDTRYQKQAIVQMFKDLNMNTRKLTRKQLNRHMERVFTTSKTRKTARQVIKYLNEELENCPVNERTLSSYKKKIIDSGVHYIYSDKGIASVDVDELLSCIYRNKRLHLKCS